jgi:thiamine biosynthesis lipoprotein
MPVSASTPVSSSWEALGTSAVLVVSDPHVLGRARAIVERELDLIDRACSRFRADSDLQRANACAGRFIPVSLLLVEAVEVALRAAELTGGDVDPTVGNALVLAGYDRDWRLLQRPAEESDRVEGPGEGDRAGRPDEGDRALCESLLDRPRRPAIRARVTPGWQAIEIEREPAAIRIPTGVRLDLGATAKAWAADRAANAVHAGTGAGSLVSLGGDIATAGAAPEAGWPIYVTDDHRSAPGRQGQTISIVSGGLATSSTAVRRWSHEGQTRHHIIDPVTGAPVARTWRTASVAAETCLDANIASTAALIRARAAPAWLEQLGLPARLVSNDGAVRLVGGWPVPADGSPVESCAVRTVAEGREVAWSSKK